MQTRTDKNSDGDSYEFTATAANLQTEDEHITQFDGAAIPTLRIGNYPFHKDFNFQIDCKDWTSYERILTCSMGVSFAAGILVASLIGLLWNQ